MSQPLNEWSQYDANVAHLVFHVQELRIKEEREERTQGLPHLLGLGPDIIRIILRYLLDIDSCRNESDNQAWTDGYQQTGNKAGLLSTGGAPQSWLFSNSGPPSNKNSCIRGSSPWNVKIDLHPAILNVSKYLLIEGMNFITSENIFIKVRTDIPHYDNHLRKFGLPVFTYHKKPYDDQWLYNTIMEASGVKSQQFRNVIDIDMRTNQTRLLADLRHFYLVPFKDIDQLIRALYLTNGREQAWFRFIINLKHVPKLMRSDIEMRMTHWMLSFRPVGSISITTPVLGFASLDGTESLTEPHDLRSFVYAVENITGLKKRVWGPLLMVPNPTEAEERHKALDRLSKLSTLFTHNRPLLTSSHPDEFKSMATLASSPLYKLLQFEYAAAVNTNNASKWRLSVLPLSTLLLSLPHHSPTQRIQTLHIHLHTLCTLGLEIRASKLLFDLLTLLRKHILEQNNLANNPAGNGAGVVGGNVLDVVARSVGRGLSKKTMTLINVTKYALENWLMVEGELGEVWFMGLWRELCRDGWAVVKRSSGVGGGSESGQGSKEGMTGRVTLEDVWQVQWRVSFD
jgi:hypothetical protein